MHLGSRVLIENGTQKRPFCTVTRGKLQKAGDFHGPEVPASSHVCQRLLPEVSV